MPKPRRRSPVKTDRRYNPVILVADHGPKERWQHSGRVLEPTERAGLLAARATEEHIIDTMRLRGFIEARESDAAFRFKLDFKLAGLQKHLVGSYNPGVQMEFNPAGGTRTDAEEAAYRRWRHALRAVGMLYSDTVVSTVCHDRWPEGAALTRLQKGLKLLADWYGLSEKTGNASGKNIQQAAAG